MLGPINKLLFILNNKHIFKGTPLLFSYHSCLATSLIISSSGNMQNELENFLEPQGTYEIVGSNMSKSREYLLGP